MYDLGFDDKINETDQAFEDHGLKILDNIKGITVG